MSTIRMIPTTTAIVAQKKSYDDLQRQKKEAQVAAWLAPPFLLTLCRILFRSLPQSPQITPSWMLTR
jgi:hypothetical protein